MEKTISFLILFPPGNSGFHLSFFFRVHFAWVYGVLCFGPFDGVGAIFLHFLVSRLRFDLLCGMKRGLEWEAEGSGKNEGRVEYCICTWYFVGMDGLGMRMAGEREGNGMRE